MRRAIDDMGARHALLKRGDAGLKLRNHALRHRARGHHVLRLVERHVRNERRLVAEVLVDAVDIGEEHALLGADCRSDLACHRVGVHVEEAAVITHGHARDNGNVAVLNESVDIVARHARHLAHASQTGIGLGGDDGARIAAGNAHGEIAVHVHGGHQLLVDLAHQHHAHDVHRGFARDAQAVDEFDGKAETLHHLADRRAAAMHDDGIHAHELEQHDIAHHVRAQLLVDHRRATVLDDDRLAGNRLDPRQGLRDEVCRLILREYLGAAPLFIFHDR